MTKGSRYAQQIIITLAGTMKLGLNWESFRVIWVSLYMSQWVDGYNHPNQSMIITRNFAKE